MDVLLTVICQLKDGKEVVRERFCRSCRMRSLWCQNVLLFMTGMVRESKSRKGKIDKYRANDQYLQHFN